jgi:PEGA domain
VRQHTFFKALLGASLAASVMLWPADALAQRRTPSGGHAGGGGGHVGGGASGSVYRGGPSRVIVAPGYRSYYYRPYFYDPFFWGSYGWGWGWGAGLGYGYGWGWYPYGWGYPYGDGYYGGYPYGYRGYAEARIEVKPKEAKVYVDGYYAGIVDDFDGWSQRLEAPPGEHDIAIYLEGYRTMHERVLFQPRKTVKISGELQRLPPGTPPEAVPMPVQPPPGQQQYRQPYGAPPYGTARGNPPQQQPQQPGDDPQAQPVQPGQPYAYGGGRTARRGGQMRAQVGDPSDFGTLSIRVQPSDAQITVDGERWDTPQGQVGFSIQMAPGRHRVEVKKEGYRAFTTEVQIEPGELTPLNVSLLSARENMD